MPLPRQPPRAPQVAVGLQLAAGRPSRRCSGMRAAARGLGKASRLPRPAWPWLSPRGGPWVEPPPGHVGRDHAVGARRPGPGVRAQQGQSCEDPDESRLPSCPCSLRPNDFPASFRHEWGFVLRLPSLKRALSARCRGEVKRRLKARPGRNLRRNRLLFCALDGAQPPFHPLESKSPLHGSDRRTSF